MKNSLYNGILAVAALVAAACVWYNLSLRESFAVAVRYEYPVVPESAAPQRDALPVYGDDGRRDAADEILYDDAQPESVVLVTFPLELNEATVDELMYIPRIGNVMAQRIVQYRDYLGGYTSLEQLLDIKGVGVQTHELITAYLYLEEADTKASAPQEDAPPEKAEDAEE